ncbi:aminotransferase class V-fold PLP-dependent enzyme [Clostridium sporogenes]|uniref:Cysteine desulfurase family protein n=2 Tax=Clostridium cochlearium TaxID=1494 RepID=A0ABY0QL08_CLOCO|nr:aminotransferase class V-fold PLP-dependent enzyme [Clostridium cochlearium]MBU5269222.1 aminotransferase class V-fold PLP-dependent enzyme [Clostridium cochlearium]SDL11281.1 cysteine desulfurase family protein [Clostridium cochlearium]
MKMNQNIYFDNAATTFPKPEIVYKTMDEMYRNIGVNAGRGSYKLARKASDIISDTRKEISNLINFKNSNRVIFSPSATHAANQVINGLEWDEFKTVYVTPFEHNAIMRPLYYIKNKYNINIEIIPFNEQTLELDYEKMKQKFSRKYPDYLFLSHVSNVTGYILPIENIIKEAKKYDAVITLDIAQSIGVIDIDIEKLGADFLIFAGHKSLYGPFGIGGYIDNSNIILNEFIVGGTGSDSLNLKMPDEYPNKYEAASHNIYAICGLNAAIKWINNTGSKEIYKKESELTKKMTEELKKVKKIRMYLPNNLEKHLGIISFNLEDYYPDELGQVLDEDFNIAVRTGYHCAPLIHDILNTRNIRGTVRLSLGYFNTLGEIDTFIEAIKEL